MKTKSFVLIYTFLYFFSPAWSQKSEVWFHPNHGQWNENVLYKVDLAEGAFYIENDGFTFALDNLHEYYGHNHHEGHEHEEFSTLKRHTIFSKFQGSSWQGEVTETDTSAFYRNYLLGSDSSKWASKVYSFQTLLLHDYYPGIDLKLEATERAVKYSFIVSPMADISNIKLVHLGADSISKDGSSVYLHTRFGAIQESNLNVWNEDGQGSKTLVEAEFIVEDNESYFHFPNGYDKNQKLIIDPELTFSSFTGSGADNWGFTAAPDPDANTFGGGIVFGSGYPITAGALDASFNGGEGSNSIDIGISKYNVNGSSLIYSTYVGGSRNEAPTSIVSNQNGELYVLGVTSSVNFPMSGSPVQPNFAGGQSTNQNNLAFSGTDLVVFKLSQDGTQLLGSTYFGGSGNDGLNLGTLLYNYGDQFRGEIIVDEASNVYFASTTRSNDFPTPNGFNSTLSGSQDAVVAKLSPNLDQVTWSTYVGGSGLESGYALQVSSKGNLYLTGGTTSNSMGFPSGNSLSFNGGNSDGYILQLDGTNSQPISGTFVGTSSYDQSFFVQLDLDDNVYVFGQTEGNMSVSNGVYGNPNSGQFIRKYDESLNLIEWTTRVGAGSGRVEISPTAFLVSDCYEIYFAGWGGQTNQSEQATQSSSAGLPTTPNAYQGNTNGNNFYVAVLAQDASELNYASFMGGISNSPNHVDGGTSRFDKKGRIYHAVCASCGSSNTGFTSTPGAFATQSGSSNCNMAVFKFDLGIIDAILTTLTPVICIPEEAIFENNSQNANQFFWDFGDGNTSTEFEPTHGYTEPGNYTVTLVAMDSTGCYEVDSAFVDISVGSFEGIVNDPGTIVCPGDTVQLQASGGVDYSWYPTEFLSDSTIANPTAVIEETTTFWVTISDSCGVDSLSVTIEVFGGDADASDDMQMCIGDTISLMAEGGETYDWNPSNFIESSSTNDEVVVSPQQTTTYSVIITTEEGCEIEKEIFVEVFLDLPEPVIESSITACKGDSVQTEISGGDTYLWRPSTGVDYDTASLVNIYVNSDMWYYVDFTNACGTVTDSLQIIAIEVDAQAGNDTIVCPKEPVNLWASGGETYLWSPPEYVADPNSPNTTAAPPSATVYSVLVTDDLGCQATATVDIDHFPTPYVAASPDYYGFKGDEVVLHAEGSGNGVYTWFPSEYINCVNCQTIVAQPPTNYTYTVEFIDENGCVAKDNVNIYFDALIYVPNTFTPNGDGFNDYFFPEGGNIDRFEMLIFNRWGELIYEFESFDDQWDGTYQGELVPDGTYVWKIIYTDFNYNTEEIVGHVNVLK